MIIHSDKMSPLPRVSYRSFWNFIDSLQQGIPARIDRSYWGERWSGSTGSQLMKAFHFLGLIDSNNMPTDRLKQLVSARGAQRTETLRQMTVESFDFLLGAVDYQTATYAQIEELLHSTYHLSSQNSSKCIKFFVRLASDAGIPLSPFLIRHSKVKHAGIGLKKTARRADTRSNMDRTILHSDDLITTKMLWDKLLLSKFPTFDPSWTDEVKLKWFDAFDSLLKRVSVKDKGS